MWVPECPCVAPFRQSGFTAPTTVSPSTNSPDSTLTRCTHRVLAIFWTSVTAALALLLAPVPVMVPSSAIWPPDSAYSGVRSSTSSTRSAPSPPCATTGTRLPSTKMPRMRACEVNSSKPVNSVGPASTSSRYAVRSACACLRAAALLGQQFPEPEFVHLQVGFGGHLEGELDRESVGVVQREGI